MHLRTYVCMYFAFSLVWEQFSTRFFTLKNEWTTAQTSLDRPSRQLDCMLFSLFPVPHHLRLSSTCAQVPVKYDTAFINDSDCRIVVAGNNLPHPKEDDEDETIALTTSHDSSTAEDTMNSTPVNFLQIEDICENPLDVEIADQVKSYHEKQQLIEASNFQQDKDVAKEQKEYTEGHNVDDEESDDYDDKGTETIHRGENSTNGEVQYMEIIVEETIEHDDCDTSVLDENDELTMVSAPFLLVQPEIGQYKILDLRLTLHQQDAVSNLPVLLVHPESGRYEILSMTITEQQHDDNAIASMVVTEVIRQVAQQDIFRRLDYDRVCNAKGVLMTDELS